MVALHTRHVNFCCTATWTSRVYIYIPFSGFPSQLGHHRARNRALCPTQQALTSHLFYTEQCLLSTAVQSIPPLHILHVCDSISALLITSPIPFSLDSTYVHQYTMFVSLWLTSSIWQTLGPSLSPTNRHSLFLSVAEQYFTMYIDHSLFSEHQFPLFWL